MTNNQIENFLKTMDLQDISVIDGGLTNKNFSFDILSERYIVRLPGDNTEKFISRENECYNDQKACDLLIAPKTYYFNPNTGVKVCQYIKEAETLNNTSAKDKLNIEKFITKIQVLHNSKVEFKGFFNYINEYEKYKNLTNINLLNLTPSDFYTAEKELYKAVERLQYSGIELVNSHNDILAANLILDDTKQMFIVDWEYSALNDKNWDLCSYIEECELDSESEKHLVNLYYNNNVSQIDLFKITNMKIIQNMIWSMWGFSKLSMGDESMKDYAITRFTRATQNIQNLEDSNLPVK